MAGGKHTPATLKAVAMMEIASARCRSNHDVRKMVPVAIAAEVVAEAIDTMKTSQAP